jgi:hypothetical protein
VLRYIHIYTEIQALEGHIELTDSMMTVNRKLKMKDIAKERQKTQFIIRFPVAVVVLVELSVIAAAL